MTEKKKHNNGRSQPEILTEIYKRDTGSRIGRYILPSRSDIGRANNRHVPDDDDDIDFSIPTSRLRNRDND